MQRSSSKKTKKSSTALPFRVKSIREIRHESDLSAVKRLYKTSDESSAVKSDLKDQNNKNASLQMRANTPSVKSKRTLMNKSFGGEMILFPTLKPVEENKEQQRLITSSDNRTNNSKTPEPTTTNKDKNNNNNNKANISFLDADIDYDIRNDDNDENDNDKYNNNNNNNCDENDDTNEDPTMEQELATLDNFATSLPHSSLQIEIIHVGIAGRPMTPKDLVSFHAMCRSVVKPSIIHFAPNVTFQDEKVAISVLRELVFGNRFVCGLINAESLFTDNNNSSDDLAEQNNKNNKNDNNNNNNNDDGASSPSKHKKSKSNSNNGNLIRPIILQSETNRIQVEKNHLNKLRNRALAVMKQREKETLRAIDVILKNEERKRFTLESDERRERALVRIDQGHDRVKAILACEKREAKLKFLDDMRNIIEEEEIEREIEQHDIMIEWRIMFTEREIFFRAEIEYHFKLEMKGFKKMDKELKKGFQEVIKKHKERDEFKRRVHMRLEKFFRFLREKALLRKLQSFHTDAIVAKEHVKDIVQSRVESEMRLAKIVVAKKEEERQRQLAEDQKKHNARLAFEDACFREQEKEFINFENHMMRITAIRSEAIRTAKEARKLIEPFLKKQSKRNDIVARFGRFLATTPTVRIDKIDEADEVSYGSLLQLQQTIFERAATAAANNSHYTLNHLNQAVYGSSGGAGAHYHYTSQGNTNNNNNNSSNQSNSNTNNNTTTQTNNSSSSTNAATAASSQGIPGTQSFYVGSSEVAIFPFAGAQVSITLQNGFCAIYEHFTKELPKLDDDLQKSYLTTKLQIDELDKSFHTSIEKIQREQKGLPGGCGKNNSQNDNNNSSSTPNSPLLNKNKSASFVSAALLQGNNNNSGSSSSSNNNNNIPSNLANLDSEIKRFYSALRDYVTGKLAKEPLVVATPFPSSTQVLRAKLLPLESTEFDLQSFVRESVSDVIAISNQRFARRSRTADEETAIFFRPHHHHRQSSSNNNNKQKQQQIPSSEFSFEEVSKKLQSPSFPARTLFQFDSFSTPQQEFVNDLSLDSVLSSKRNSARTTETDDEAANNLDQQQNFTNKEYKKIVIAENQSKNSNNHHQSPFIPVEATSSGFKSTQNWKCNTSFVSTHDDDVGNNDYYHKNTSSSFLRLDPALFSSWLQKIGVGCMKLYQSPSDLAHLTGSSAPLRQVIASVSMTGKFISFKPKLVEYFDGTEDLFDCAGPFSVGPWSEVKLTNFEALKPSSMRSPSRLTSLRPSSAATATSSLDSGRSNPNSPTNRRLKAVGFAVLATSSPPGSRPTSATAHVLSGMGLKPLPPSPKSNRNNNNNSTHEDDDDRAARSPHNSNKSVMVLNNNSNSAKLPPTGTTDENNKNTKTNNSNNTNSNSVVSHPLVSKDMFRIFDASIGESWAGCAAEITVRPPIVWVNATNRMIRLETAEYQPSLFSPSLVLDYSYPVVPFPMIPLFPKRNSSFSVPTVRNNDPFRLRVSYEINEEEEPSSVVLRAGIVLSGLGNSSSSTSTSPSINTSSKSNTTHSSVDSPGNSLGVFIEGGQREITCSGLHLGDILSDDLDILTAKPFTKLQHQQDQEIIHRHEFKKSPTSQSASQIALMFGKQRNSNTTTNNNTITPKFFRNIDKQFLVDNNCSDDLVLCMQHRGRVSSSSAAKDKKFDNEQEALFANSNENNNSNNSDDNKNQQHVEATSKKKKRVVLVEILFKPDKIIQQRHGYAKLVAEVARRIVVWSENSEQAKNVLNTSLLKAPSHLQQQHSHATSSSGSPSRQPKVTSHQVQEQQQYEENLTTYFSNIKSNLHDFSVVPPTLFNLNVEGIVGIEDPNANANVHHHQHQSSSENNSNSKNFQMLNPFASNHQISSSSSSPSPTTATSNNIISTIKSSLDHPYQSTWIALCLFRRSPKPLISFKRKELDEAVITSFMKKLRDHNRNVRKSLIKIETEKKKASSKRKKSFSGPAGAFASSASLNISSNANLEELLKEQEESDNEREADAEEAKNNNNKLRGAADENNDDDAVINALLGKSIPSEETFQELEPMITIRAPTSINNNSRSMKEKQLRDMNESRITVAIFDEIAICRASDPSREFVIFDDNDVEQDDEKQKQLNQSQQQQETSFNNNEHHHSRSSNSNQHQQQATTASPLIKKHSTVTFTGGKRASSSIPTAEGGATRTPTTNNNSKKFGASSSNNNLLNVSTFSSNGGNDDSVRSQIRKREVPTFAQILKKWNNAHQIEGGIIRVSLIDLDRNCVALNDIAQRKSVDEDAEFVKFKNEAQEQQNRNNNSMLLLSTRTRSNTMMSSNLQKNEQTDELSFLDPTDIQQQVQQHQHLAGKPQFVFDSSSSSAAATSEKIHSNNTNDNKHQIHLEDYESFEIETNFGEQNVVSGRSGDLMSKWKAPFELIPSSSSANNDTFIAQVSTEITRKVTTYEQVEVKTLKQRRKISIVSSSSASPKEEETFVFPTDDESSQRAEEDKKNETVAFGGGTAKTSESPPIISSRSPALDLLIQEEEKEAQHLSLLRDCFSIIPEENEKRTNEEQRKESSDEEVHQVTLISGLDDFESSSSDDDDEAQLYEIKYETVSKTKYVKETVKVPIAKFHKQKNFVSIEIIPSAPSNSNNFIITPDLVSSMIQSICFKTSQSPKWAPRRFALTMKLSWCTPKNNNNKYCKTSLSSKENSPLPLYLWSPTVTQTVSLCFAPCPFAAASSLSVSSSSSNNNNIKNTSKTFINLTPPDNTKLWIQASPDIEPSSSELLKLSDAGISLSATSLSNNTLSSRVSEVMSDHFFTFYQRYLQSAVSARKRRESLLADGSNTSSRNNTNRPTLGASSTTFEVKNVHDGSILFNQGNAIIVEYDMSRGACFADVDGFQLSKTKDPYLAKFGTKVSSTSWVENTPFFKNAKDIENEERVESIIRKRRAGEEVVAAPPTTTIAGFAAALGIEEPKDEGNISLSFAEKAQAHNSDPSTVALAISYRLEELRKRYLFPVLTNETELNEFKKCEKEDIEREEREAEEERQRQLAIIAREKKFGRRKSTVMGGSASLTSASPLSPGAASPLVAATSPLPSSPVLSSPLPTTGLFRLPSQLKPATLIPAEDQEHHQENSTDEINSKTCFGGSFFKNRKLPQHLSGILSNGYKSYKTIPQSEITLKDISFSSSSSSAVLIIYKQSLILYFVKDTVLSKTELNNLGKLLSIKCPSPPVSSTNKNGGVAPPPAVRVTSSIKHLRTTILDSTIVPRCWNTELDVVYCLNTMSHEPTTDLTFVPSQQQDGNAKNNNNSSSPSKGSPSNNNKEDTTGSSTTADNNNNQSSSSNTLIVPLLQLRPSLRITPQEFITSEHLLNQMHLGGSADGNNNTKQSLSSSSPSPSRGGAKKDQNNSSAAGIDELTLSASPSLASGARGPPLEDLAPPNKNLRAGRSTQFASMIFACDVTRRKFLKAICDPMSSLSMMRFGGAEVLLHWSEFDFNSILCHISPALETANATASSSQYKFPFLQSNTSSYLLSQPDRYSSAKTKMTNNNPLRIKISASPSEDQQQNYRNTLSTIQSTLAAAELTTAEQNKLKKQKLHQQHQQQQILLAAQQAEHEEGEEVFVASMQYTSKKQEDTPKNLNIHQKDDNANKIHLPLPPTVHGTLGILEPHEQRQLLEDSVFAVSDLIDQGSNISNASASSIAAPPRQRALDISNHPDCPARMCRQWLETNTSCSITSTSEIVFNNDGFVLGRLVSHDDLEVEIEICPPSKERVMSNYCSSNKAKSTSPSSKSSSKINNNATNNKEFYHHLVCERFLFFMGIWCWRPKNNIEAVPIDEDQQQEEVDSDLDNDDENNTCQNNSMNNASGDEPHHHPSLSASMTMKKGSSPSASPGASSPYMVTNTSNLFDSSMNGNSSTAATILKNRHHDGSISVSYSCFYKQQPDLTFGRFTLNLTPPHSEQVKLLHHHQKSSNNNHTSNKPSLSSGSPSRSTLPLMLSPTSAGLSLLSTPLPLLRRQSFFFGGDIHLSLSSNNSNSNNTLANNKNFFLQAQKTGITFDTNLLASLSISPETVLTVRFQYVWVDCEIIRKEKALKKITSGHSNNNNITNMNGNDDEVADSLNVTASNLQLPLNNTEGNNNTISSSGTKQRRPSYRDYYHYFAPVGIKVVSNDEEQILPPVKFHFPTKEVVLQEDQGNRILVSGKPTAVLFPQHQQHHHNHHQHSSSSSSLDTYVRIFPGLGHKVSVARLKVFDAVVKGAHVIDHNNNKNSSNASSSSTMDRKIEILFLDSMSSWFENKNYRLVKSGQSARDVAKEMYWSEEKKRLERKKEREEKRQNELEEEAKMKEIQYREINKEKEKKWSLSGYEADAKEKFLEYYNNNNSNETRSEEEPKHFSSSALALIFELSQQYPDSRRRHFIKQEEDETQHHHQRDFYSATVPSSSFNPISSLGYLELLIDAATTTTTSEDRPHQDEDNANQLFPSFSAFGNNDDNTTSNNNNILSSMMTSGSFENSGRNANPHHDFNDNNNNHHHQFASGSVFSASGGDLMISSGALSTSQQHQQSIRGSMSIVSPMSASTAKVSISTTKKRAHQQQMMIMKYTKLIKSCFDENCSDKERENFEKRLEKLKPFMLMAESDEDRNALSKKSDLTLWPTPLQLMNEVLKSEKGNTNHQTDAAVSSDDDEINEEPEEVKKLPNAVRDFMRLSNRKDRMEKSINNNKMKSENDIDDDDNENDDDTLPKENASTQTIHRQLCLMTTIHGSTDPVAVLSRVLY